MNVYRIMHVLVRACICAGVSAVGASALLRLCVIAGVSECVHFRLLYA
jgi:hypothetical protein